MLGALWLWPALRVSRAWYGLAFATLVGAAVWLGLDVREFLETRPTTDKAWIRLLHTLISATHLPIAPVLVGSLLNGWISRTTQTKRRPPGRGEPPGGRSSR